MKNYQDIDIEKSILSTCIYSSDNAKIVFSELSVDDFTLIEHQKIYEAMQKCLNKYSSISLELLQNVNKEVLDSIAERGAILNIHGYIKNLKELSIKRGLLNIAHQIPAYIDSDDEVDEVVNGISQKMFALTNTMGSKDIKKVPEVVSELMEFYKERKENANKGLLGLSTGISELNYATKGFKDGEMIVIAARPSMGKTTLALNFIENALDEGHGVVLFSLEMSAVQILQKMISSKTSIELQKLLTGDLTNDEWGRVQEACNLYGDKKFFIYDGGYANVQTIRSILRYQKELNKDIKLCVIDYIGLMQGSGKFSERHLQVADISRSLKLLARELDMPIIVLSQLNRALESRPDKRPMLSDLRESGSIEQDADTILFVYRESVYLEKEEKNRQKEHELKHGNLEGYTAKYIPNPDTDKAEIIIGKNRHGNTGIVDLTFYKKHSRFSGIDIAQEFQA